MDFFGFVSVNQRLYASKIKFDRVFAQELVLHTTLSGSDTYAARRCGEGLLGNVEVLRSAQNDTA